MSRAEERALEAYPPLMQYTSLMSATLKNKTDANLPKREIYIEGYEQAEKDLMEKFKMWVAHNGYTAQESELVYNDFKQFITKN